MSRPNPKEDQSKRAKRPHRKRPKRKRSLARRILRIIGWSIAVPVLLLLIVIGLLHTGPGQRWVRDKIIERIDQRLTGSCHIGELDFTLFGDLALRDVSLRSATGEEVIKVAALEVSPQWLSLLGPTPTVERIALQGVNLHLVQRSDGSSNLAGLFKPKPPSPQPEPPAAPPPNKDVRIQKLHVGDVNLTIEKPDGTRIALEQFGLDGKISAQPARKSAQVELAGSVAGLSVHKQKEGLSISLDNIETGLGVELADGAVQVKLAPTKAVAKLEQKGAPVREIPIEFAAVNFSLGPKQLAATIDQLILGALVLQSLELGGGVASDGLVGEQSVQLLGMRIAADRLNSLLQRRLLATDIDIATQVYGPAKRLVLGTAVHTDGGVLTVDGALDVADMCAPRLELLLAGHRLDSEKLVFSDKLPASSIEHFEIALQGRGTTLADAQADVELHIVDTAVGKYPVDEVKLNATLAGGRLWLDELSVEAMGSRLLVKGWVDLLQKQVAMHLTIQSDVGDTLEQLRNTGLKVSTRLPRKTVVLPPEVLTVDVRGDLEGLLYADVNINSWAIAGGSVLANINAELFRHAEPPPGQKPVQLRHAEGIIELRDLDLNQLAALRGKKLDALRATLGGKLAFDGIPDEPRLHYQLAVRGHANELRSKGTPPPTVVATAQGQITPNELRLGLDVTGANPAGTVELMTAKVRAPLIVAEHHKGIAMHRPWRVEMTVPRRPLADFIQYVPKRLLVDKKTGKPRRIPQGQVYTHLLLEGTPAQPRGSMQLDANAAAVGGQTQRLKLDTTIGGAGPKVVMGSKLQAWLAADRDAALVGNTRVELPRSPLLPGKPDLSWSASLEVPAQQLGDLPLPPHVAAILKGNASAKVALRGNLSDLAGTVNLDLKDVVASGKGPLDAALNIAIARQGTSLDLSLDVANKPVLRATPKLARSSTGLLSALRDKNPNKSLSDKLGNPTLSGNIEIIKHPVRLYSFGKPKNLSLPGKLAGRLRLGGDLQTPTALGVIAYHDYATVSGAPGLAAIALRANKQQLATKVHLGLHSDKTAPVEMSAKVDRPVLGKYLAAKRCYAAAGMKTSSSSKSDEDDAGACPAEAQLPVAVKVAATNVDLKHLVPDFAMKGTELDIAGTLNWWLNGKLILDPQPYALATLHPDSQLDGEFAITKGALNIPGSSRRYHDIELRINHDVDTVRIDSIALRESDIQRRGRKFDISGELSLENWRPDELLLWISADEWLVFGADLVGPADAPRGTLTMDAAVTAELGSPLKKVEVDIAELELLVPARFTRAHQPEKVSVGDVIFLDETKQAPGKLPVSFEALSQDGDEPDIEPEQPAAQPGEQESAEKEPRGLDVTVRLNKPVHLLQFPMNLYATGEIEIKRRPGSKSIDGKLTMVDGDLHLGGRKHDLQKGSIIFNKEHSGGFMELWFARRGHNATLRDMSEASGGKDVTIHMVGPLNARKTTLSGAGSPGTLFDLLSVHNAGRQRYLAQPDMPATFTVEHPQHMNLLLLSYLAVNVPHLLFLDRVAAWSDPYDGRGTEAYGRVQHAEAEGYNQRGNVRVRAVVRPSAAGQSNAELQLDWLLRNTSRSAFGVGVSAGSRLGGGPGVFFEWSSKD